MMLPKVNDSSFRYMKLVREVAYLNFISSLCFAFAARPCAALSLLS